MCSFRGSYANRGSGTERASSDDVGATFTVARRRNARKREKKRGGPVQLYGSANRYSLYSAPPVAQKPKRQSQNRRQSVQAVQSPIRP